MRPKCSSWALSDERCRDVKTAVRYTLSDCGIAMCLWLRFFYDEAGLSIFPPVELIAMYARLRTDK